MPRKDSDLDKNLAPEVDKTFLRKTLAYLENAGAPSGSVTPDFQGQFLWDSSNGDWYISTGTANTDWALVTIGSNISAAELAVLDGLLATTAELNRVADVSTRIVNAGASLTLTEAAHDGKTIVMDQASGSTLTLPAATGSGARFRVVVGTTVTSNQHRIDVVGNDSMVGNAILAQDGGDTVVMFEAAADTDRINMNGTTTGGLAGTVIMLEDIAADKWAVELKGAATGTEATPFQTGQVS